MQDKIYMATVSQVNSYIKQVFDKNVILSNIWIKGEISNFKQHYSGHLYLTLKDEGGVLKAVMFKGSAQSLVFAPQDGMKVIARGRISVYEKGGAYQLYIEEMQPDGVGALHIAFEQMKARLEAEGLFASEHKRPIPAYPQKIGVVTASTGAAVRDIIHVLGRRAPYARIVLYPTVVQGEGAAQSICEAISYFNQAGGFDVLIVGRGGGSIEDLWGFNEEIVARAIYHSKIPIISAVGHETDFTIADFVADLRAPTPSAAAEMAAMPLSEIYAAISSLETRNVFLINACLKAAAAKMERLSVKNPKDRIENQRITVDALSQELVHLFQAKFETEKQRYAMNVSKLAALSPLAVLSRGYSLATDQNGKVLSSAADFRRDDDFTLVLSDGKKHCRVLD